MSVCERRCDDFFGLPWFDCAGFLEEAMGSCSSRDRLNPILHVDHKDLMPSSWSTKNRSRREDTNNMAQENPVGQPTRSSLTPRSFMVAVENASPLTAPNKAGNVPRSFYRRTSQQSEKRDSTLPRSQSFVPRTTVEDVYREYGRSKDDHDESG